MKAGMKKMIEEMPTVAADVVRFMGTKEEAIGFLQDQISIKIMEIESIEMMIAHIQGVN